MKNNNLFVPLLRKAKIYPNADADKFKIYSDNKDKVGIYLWRNLVNEKKYIGSSVDLRRRFFKYYNFNYLITSYINVYKI